MEHTPAVDRRGFTVLPVDEDIYPQEVRDLAHKIDTLEIQWEEVRAIATEQGQRQALHDAELRDAERLKAALLSGETEGLDQTPNLDAARHANKVAEVKVQALAKALNQSYTQLHTLMLANASQIIASSQVIYAKAVKDYRKALDTIDARYTAVRDAFASAAGLPRLAAALDAHSSTMGLVPETLAAPAVDTSAARRFLARAEALADLTLHAGGLPAHTGVQQASNGLQQRVDVLFQRPAFGDGGEPTNGPITMDDGTQLTRDHLATIEQAWQTVRQAWNL